MSLIEAVTALTIVSLVALASVTALRVAAKARTRAREALAVAETIQPIVWAVRERLEKGERQGTGAIREMTYEWSTEPVAAAPNLLAESDEFEGGRRVGGHVLELVRVTLTVAAGPGRGRAFRYDECVWHPR
ncbi:hypothetical protein [Deferrisoma palaeochoriense]